MAYARTDFSLIFPSTRILVHSVSLSGSDVFSVQVCVYYPYHRAAVDTSRDGDLGSCSLLSPFAESGMFANFGCDGEL